MEVISRLKEVLLLGKHDFGETVYLGTIISRIKKAIEIKGGKL